MTELQTEPREYQIPDGCPMCARDLPVRVTASGASAVCKHCGWIGRPKITITAKGWKVSYEAAKA